MLGAQNSLSRSRQPSPGSVSIASAGSGSLETDWRTFSREEGRRAALEFIDKSRAYVQSANIPRLQESALVREFATSLTETLSASQVQPSSSSAQLRSLSPPSLQSTGRKTGGGSKHWWNIFKRNKGDRGVSLGRRDSIKRGFHVDNDPGILLDGILQQMNLVKDTPTWERCRLLLIDRHGNHQLEVYSPPKV